MVNTLLKKINLTSRSNRKSIHMFIKHEAVPGKTLDIGANFYNKENYHRYFSDVTTFNIAQQDNIVIDVIGDVHAIPFTDNTFDSILCTEVLEHLHTPWKAIDEMYRVLKPGGKVILTTTFLMSLHDTPGDYFRYTPYGLRRLFQKFENVQVRPATSTFESWYILAQRISFQTDWGAWKWLKVPFLLFAKALTIFQYVIKKEYGDISRTKPVETIMSSGFFVSAYKKKQT